MNRLERWLLEQMENAQKRARWMIFAYVVSLFMVGLGLFLILTTIFRR